MQFQFIRTLFDPADANGDGKLTKAEFDAYFDLQDSFRNVALAVTPGRPNADAVPVARREPRRPARRSRTAHRVGPAHLAGARQWRGGDARPRFSRACRSGSAAAWTAFNINQVQVDVRPNPNQAVPVPQKGPLWFRKMDRNGDGDVSRSEFLGTKAEFDAIDTDHDDLISLDEAEAYDKKMRERTSKTRRSPTRSRTSRRSHRRSLRPPASLRGDRLVCAHREVVRKLDSRCQHSLARD